MPGTGPGAASKSAQSCRTDLLFLLQAAFREEQEAEHGPEQYRADHADNRQSFQKERGQRGDQSIGGEQHIPPETVRPIIAVPEGRRGGRIRTAAVSGGRGGFGVLATAARWFL